MAKYEVKKHYIAIYLCMVIACFLLMMLRWISHLSPNIVLLPNSILLHITNFSLSLLVLLCLGFAVLVFGGTIKSITIVGLLIIAFNFIYEIFLPVLNTPDIADALFGLLGVVLAYVYLIRLKAKGLIMKQ